MKIMEKVKNTIIMVNYVLKENILKMEKIIMDSEYYYSDGNLISYLKSTRTIGNNTFDYSPIEEIILIPDEILFYRLDNNTLLTDGERIGSEQV